MAVGNTASISASSINSQVAADAAYMYDFYKWCKKRYGQWNGNVTGALMTSLTISAGDQATINTVSADMNRLINIFEGGTQTVGENIVNDCVAVMGIS